MRITSGWYKVLLDRIKCLETELERKSKIIEHLIKENEMLVITSVSVPKDQLSSVYGKFGTNIDFPATTKVEKHENKLF